MNRSGYFSRRSLFRLGSGMVVASVLAPVANAGRFREAVIEFVETNYRDDIDRMSDREVSSVARRVLAVEDDIERSAPDLRDHVDDTWSVGRGSQRHTERCPYCISVAQQVERRAPELTPVQNRVPRCFVIQSVPYIASQWGTLHRYVQGRTGPAEGVIWFSNGQYIGVGYNGLRLSAQPAC